MSVMCVWCECSMAVACVRVLVPVLVRASQDHSLVTSYSTTRVEPPLYPSTPQPHHPTTPSSQQRATSPRPPPPPTHERTDGHNRTRLDTNRPLPTENERTDTIGAVSLRLLTAAAAQLRKPVVDNWWQTETGWPICGFQVREPLESRYREPLERS